MHFLTTRTFLVLCLLLFAIHVPANAMKPSPLVSVFDVKQKAVVKVFPLTADLAAEFKRFLQLSPVFYGGLSIEPNNGMVLHIPLDSPIKVEHKLYPSPIREIYVFHEAEKRPKALLFFASARPPIVVLLQSDAGEWIKRILSSY